MHLKSLTVRGFKSFASATTFEFEPGVTAVVGPNGSGKSNVVDALAWVMGEQGAKTLRGGKMEDVIFAGTSGRAPLGRAQVSLTIDNSDGALPIEYSEVTISRTLFRAGGSEYAINGEACRLLDLQELLSDYGLGREMHVIVGQGQLDKVLHATPEDRRGFIEEAAGVLKHRRRKEKTLRKLDAMQANLSRVSDLTAELRRQLTPLGKQAQVARRAQSVQFDVRDAKSRLYADDLVTLRAALASDTEDEAALKARKDEVARLLDEHRATTATLAESVKAAAPAAEAAANAWYELSAARERLVSLGSLAQERRRNLSTPIAHGPTSDPAHLEAQRKSLLVSIEGLDATVQRRELELAEATEQKIQAEEHARAEENRVRLRLRAAADQRESRARLAGAVATAESRVESSEAELERLRRSVESVEARRRDIQREFAALEQRIARSEDGEEGLDDEFEKAAAEQERLARHTAELTEQQRDHEARKQNAITRLEALRLGLHREDAAAEVLNSGVEGLAHRLSDLITVEPGYESALATALGYRLDAVVATDMVTAQRVNAWVNSNERGRIDIVLAQALSHSTTDSAALARTAQATADFCRKNPGLKTALSVATANAPLTPDVLTILLANVVLAKTLPEAVVALERDPADVIIAAASGELLSRTSLRGGMSGPPSQLELHAAIAAAEAERDEAQTGVERLIFTLSAAQTELLQAQDRTERALSTLNENDAVLSAVAEKLAQLGADVRSADAEQNRLMQSIEQAEQTLMQRRLELTSAVERLSAAEEDVEPDEADDELRQTELANTASLARATEMEARLGLRSAQEQVKGLRGRADSLSRSIAAEKLARIQAEEKERDRKFKSKKASAVLAATTTLASFATVALEAAAAERDTLAELRARDESALAAVRAESEGLAAELAALTDSVHRDELARAEQMAKITALEQKVLEELSLTPEHLIAEFGPEQPVPVTATSDKWASLREEVDEDGNPIPLGVPFVREEQLQRLRRAERDLASLGKVNPLALEEFAALEQRHGFLARQLEDLKSSRKDLIEIIHGIDRKVEEVFTSAFADTAEQFKIVFATLFPGGEGALVLTNPDDMLTTGIEVHARPAGKKIKRLSLLSGGERSLTAVALLVAIFKARPSPFYVMDEVEAALDDTNLGRLITIFEQLRETSQLIVITHQKRTMEVADALYGVSMRGDGVSTVISQRLAREPS